MSDDVVFAMCARRLYIGYSAGEMGRGTTKTTQQRIKRQSNTRIMLNI